MPRRDRLGDHRDEFTNEFDVPVTRDPKWLNVTLILIVIFVFVSLGFCL